MSKYLLEVGVEELPYKFIPMAISQLESGFKTFLDSNNVKYENIKVMATIIKHNAIIFIVSGNNAIVASNNAISQPFMLKEF